jgi:serine phosphatase RsbU (regulator of sigma subunit)
LTGIDRKGFCPKPSTHPTGRRAELTARATRGSRRESPISTSLRDAPETLPGVEDPVTNLKVNVLVVDDQPTNLLAVEAVLGDLGLNLVNARSGEEALRHLLSEEFALILLDVRMPGMDGFETAELIRKRKRTRHTPIIFLTAVETDDAKVFEGYAHGAVDYLLKPPPPEVLRSKVSVFVDIFKKTEQIKRQAELLRQWEHREHERQLAEAKARWEAERLASEIRIAREIQQRLFPAAPLPLPGFDIAGASFPAEATGGDYFDYIPMQDGSLAVVIADVSGHGFGPALLMAELRAYLRAFLLTRTDVGQIVGLLNRALAGDTDDRFATLFLARLDPRERTIVYANAGHACAYILDAAGDVKAHLTSTGIPLAVLAEGEFVTEPGRRLQPGEMVLLYTDGIMEAHGADDKLFGADQVVRLAKAYRHRPAREIVHLLHKQVCDHCSPQTPPDDMTVIVIKVEDVA